MNGMAERARAVMARQPSLVLRLATLARLIHEDGATTMCRREELLRALLGRPDLFQVIQPRGGLWHPLGGALTNQGWTGVSEGPRPDQDPWIVSLPRPDREGGEGVGTLLDRIRENMVWLTRALDQESVTAVARWIQLVREEERLRLRLYPAGQRTDVTEPA